MVLTYAGTDSHSTNPFSTDATLHVRYPRRLCLICTPKIGHTSAEEDQEAWIRAMYYLFMLVYHQRKAKEGEEIAAKLRESVGRVRGRGRGKEVLEMAQTLAEKLMEQGEERGRIETKREDLLALMSEKFGTLPAEVVERVRAMADLEALDRQLRRLIHADRLDDMQF